MKRQRRSHAEHADDEFDDPRMPDRVWWLVVAALLTATVILGTAIATIRW